MGSETGLDYLSQPLRPHRADASAVRSSADSLHASLQFGMRSRQYSGWRLLDGCISCAPTASASTCATPKNSSAFFNGSIMRTNLRAPASVPPSCTGSSSATAAASGRKPLRMPGRRSSSPGFPAHRRKSHGPSERLLARVPPSADEKQRYSPTRALGIPAPIRQVSQHCRRRSGGGTGPREATGAGGF